MATGTLAFDISQLMNMLGVPSITVLSGESDYAVVESWIEEADVMPSPIAAERIRLAAEAASQLLDNQGATIARQWFLSANVDVDGSADRITPLMALRKSIPGDDTRSRLQTAMSNLMVR